MAWTFAHRPMMLRLSAHFFPTFCCDRRPLPPADRVRLGRLPAGLREAAASRYPVLSLRDRRRIAFGQHATHDNARVDRAWSKAADAAGVVILETEAVERSGKRGWRVVPKTAAEAIRTAVDALNASGASTDSATP